MTILRLQPRLVSLRNAGPCCAVGVCVAKVGSHVKLAAAIPPSDTLRAPHDSVDSLGHSEGTSVAAPEVRSAAARTAEGCCLQRCAAHNPATGERVLCPALIC